MLPKTITDYLTQNRNRHLSELSELLAIPSIANVSDGACDRAAKWLGEYLKRLGMTARIIPSVGPSNVLAEFHKGDHRPTLLLYGHYDVQPPDPLESWQSPPFSPQVRGGCLYARGATDDKGQLFAHLMAIEAWQKAGGGLPVNLKVFLEGQEEIGSPHLEPFLASYRNDLVADAAIISDSEFFADGLPSLTTALRGLAYVEVIVRGPHQDLHSGIHGGAVRNPANVLAALVAALHDAHGGVTIPGFYNDVVEPSPEERASWDSLPFSKADYATSLGVTALAGGEEGRSVLERRWSRPTLDCNGLVAGYAGAGAKTIIPAAAMAKISMRLVPRQQPRTITTALEVYLRQLCPAGTTVKVEVLTTANPVLLAADSPAMRAARAALVSAFESEPVLVRHGASVPIVEMLQRMLKLDAVPMGFGLPSDNPHSPNEHFRLDQLWRGSIAAAAFMGNLAGEIGQKSSR
jgi:acetylornithine deacetylase/succinyl-diaminopimelate desuccinylase-like protein